MADGSTRGTAIDLLRGTQTVIFIFQKNTNPLLPSFPQIRDDDDGGMYRTAAKRLLCNARHYNVNAGLRFRHPQTLVASSRFSTTGSQPFSNPHTIHDSIPISTTESPNLSDSASSSSSSSSSTDENAKRYETPKHGAKYEDEHARLLHASLQHVVRTLILFLFFVV